MKNRQNKPTPPAPTTAKAKTPTPRNDVTTDQIRARAHEIYLKRGGAQGHEIEDWVAAERELRTR
jgi:hypothetical protein